MATIFVNHLALVIACFYHILREGRYGAKIAHLRLTYH